MPLPPKVTALAGSQHPEKPVRRLKLITKTPDPSFTGGNKAPAPTSDKGSAVAAVRLSTKTLDPELGGGGKAPAPSSDKGGAVAAVRLPTKTSDPELGGGGKAAAAPAAPGAGMALLAEAVLKGCRAALDAEAAAEALPAEAARCLAEAVRHVRAAAWEAGAERAADFARTLEPLAGVWGALPDVFAALCGGEAASDASSEKKALAAEADVEAGMWLAAAHFDSAAVLGPGALDGDGSLTDAILKFLTHHGKVALSAAGPADLQELGDDGSSHKNRAIDPLIAALRAVHHALAAARYTPMPATHRVVPLVVRCLTAVQPLERLQAAAADLLQAVLGQADEQLQGLALEQLIAACGKGNASGHGPGSRPRGRKAARRALSNHTSAVLRAVCAACVPIGGDAARSDADDCKGAGEAATQVALDLHERAEGRTVALVDGVVRRCLLGVRERERDPDAWAWLEAFLAELLDVSGELAWVAAPMVLLFLAKALVRVASAPRSVDMAWTQREFAVRLLGNVAAALVREHASIRDTSDETEMACLVGKSKSGSPPKGTPEDLSRKARQLFLAFLSAAPAADGVLFPPCLSAPRARDGKAEAAKLTTAVLPAGHAAYSCSFLLCSWAASESGHGQRRAPQKKAQRKAQRADVAAGGDGGGASDQLAATWRVADGGDEPKAANPGQKGARAPSGAPQGAARLYKRTVHQDAAGPLARTRRIALEALLSQVKSSPFAFVRRQAVGGLNAACKADIQLASSRSVADAIAHGLHDESACVRVAFIDLIDHLLSSKSSVLTPTAVAECQASIHLRLADTSFLVRRAAFRVACKALRAGDPQLVANAADLLRRIQHETQQVRDTVLTAVEHALLAPPLTKAVLEHLVGVAGEPGIDSVTIRDLLRAHKAALEPQVYESSMRTLVVDAVACISEILSAGDVTPWTLILAQIGVEHPVAVHSHIWQLREWLAEGASSSKNADILALQACRVLSDVLPSWAEQADGADRTELAGHLQEALAPLLQERGSRLTRAAAECLCVVAAHVSRDLAHALGLYRRSLLQLVSAVESQAALDGEGQRLLSRHAWIVGTMLEFLDVEAVQEQDESQQQQEIDGVALPPSEFVEVAVKTLSLLALGGPPALRPSLVPCIGFLLRRHSRFLRAAQGGVGGPLEVFRIGLRGNPASAWGAAMLGQAAEALAALLGSYEESAQVQSPSSGSESGRDWGATVAECLKLPAVSEAVQRLAALQPEMLEVLQAAREPSVARNVVAALRALSVLGVLHPTSAMPALLAASLAGFQAAAAPTRRLALRLLEASPRLLASRFGAGLRSAAAVLLKRGARHGSLVADKWRFTAMCESYTERLDTRSARDHFIDVIVEEFEALACTAHESSAGAGAQSTAIVAHQPASAETEGALRWTRTPAHVLFSAELLVGTLAALPYCGQLEVARLILKTARFLTLRVIPLLAEGGHGSSAGRGTLFGTCVAATVLKALCMHLAPGAGEVERLLAVGLAEADGGDVEDQQLPASFWRKAPLNVADLMLELAEVANDPAALLSLLQRHVPIDSPLLRGVEGAGQGVGSGAAKGRRRGKRAASDVADAQPAGQPRKQRRRGAAAGKRGAGAKVAEDGGETAEDRAAAEE